MSSVTILEEVILAERENPGITEEQLLGIERIKDRVDVLDDRLDNIDSMVSAVVERVMSQLVTLNITCPHCGKDVEIALIGNQKPRR